MNNETIPANEHPADPTLDDHTVLAKAESVHELLPPEPGESALTGVEERSTALHARKRTECQRKKDLMEIEEMMGQRLNAVEIARSLNARADIPYSISAAQVRYDVRAIRSQLAETFLHGSKPEFIVREVHHLELLERIAMDHYRRSQKDRYQSSQTSVSATDKVTGEVQTHIRKKIAKAQRDGDTGLLALVQKISEQRCRLLGLFGATVLADKAVQELSEEEMERAEQCEKILREEIEVEIREDIEEEVRAEVRAKIEQANAAEAE